MKSLPKSHHIYSKLQRSSKFNRSFSSSSTCISLSNFLFSPKPNSESSLPNQSSILDDLKEANSPIPISQNDQFSLKNDPSALEHFQRAEKQPGLDEKVDNFFVRFHKLMGLKNKKGAVKALVGKAKFPDAITAINGLKDCSKRFDFDLGSRVFNFLLYGFITNLKVKCAINCFDWMLKNDINLWVGILNDLLHMLVVRRMSEKAREVFDKASCKGIVGNASTIREMMRACLSDGKLSEADRYFRVAKEKGVELGQVEFSYAVEVAYIKCDSNAACALLKEMKEKGWTPSGVDYSKAIVSCVKEYNMVEALRLKDEMISSGEQMTFAAAMSLMRGYCVSGDLESALGLFESLPELGVSPEAGIYSVLIHGCCVKGRIEKAYELYEQMIGKGLYPSRLDFSMLIKGHVEANLLQKACKLINTVVNPSWADVYLFNMIMSPFCRHGRVDEARQLWGKMVKLGVSPDAHTFTILMDGHFRLGEVEKALKWFDEMVQRRIECTDVTYSTVITGLSRHGQTSEARETLEKFIKEDNFVPSSMTYNILIDGFVKAGDLNFALAVYTEMGKKGVSPTVVTYKILIDAFFKNGDFDRAMEIRDEMISKGLELDITAYGTFIDGFWKRKDMKSAVRLFNELCEAGMSPNILIYISMMSDYRSLNNVEEALLFHQKMMEKGISCDLETYTTLIDGLPKDEKLTLALEFYANMLAKGIEPDRITYMVLVIGLCKKGELEIARDLFNDVEKKGLIQNQNSLIYNALIAGYFMEGNLPEAFKMYDEMLDRGHTPDRRTFDFLMNANFKPSNKSSRFHLLRQ